MTNRMMHLGLSIQSAGYHFGAWRLPASVTNPDTNIRYYAALAQRAERAKFDMVFFADWLAIRESLDNIDGISRIAGVGRLEPLTALSAISQLTDKIGLVGTVSTTFNEPYNVARIMSSLDHISAGRAGWNVVTSTSDNEARNFGGEHLINHADRYARAREFVDVVWKLWDSWDDGAFIRDKQSGRYFDPDKCHPVNHKGEHFQVQGPLNMERPIQGRPVISQAGASPAGQELAAATADMIFALNADVETGRLYYQSVKGRMAKYGRQPHELKVMPGVMPIIAETEEAAQRHLQDLSDLISEELGLALISSKLGDLRGLDVDKPIPNLAAFEDNGSMLNIFRKMAAQGMTIRQIWEQAAMRTWTPPVGTPEQIADYLEASFLGGAADGFNILLPETTQTADLFFEGVVPELQKRGLFRTDYDSDTLRGHLGLAPPENRRVA